MYPATKLNELLSEALPLAMEMSGSKLAAALNKPYLTATNCGETFDEEVAKKIGMKDADCLFKTPFDDFRFCLDLRDQGQLMGFLQRREGLVKALVLHRHKTQQESLKMAALVQITSPTTKGGKAALTYGMFDLHAKQDVTSLYQDGAQFNEEEKALNERTKDRKDGDPPLDVTPRERATLQGMIRKLERSRDTSKAIVGFMDALHVIFQPSEDQRKGDKLEHAPGFQTDEKGELPKHAVIFYFLYLGLEIFCYEYLCPVNFLVRVQPSSPGKSVQWLQAREHYTLVNRHHPANDESAKNRLAIDSPTAIQRIAHSRRAHTRLLKSPRYKDKVGVRIFIRATWVGPKEWRDTAGQTYKICFEGRKTLDSVVSSPANAAAPAHVAPLVIPPIPKSLLSTAQSWAVY